MQANNLIVKLQLLEHPSNANNGQIYIGLCFKHVSSSLTVMIDSARNLKAVNPFTQDSDPYVKYVRISRFSSVLRSLCSLSFSTTNRLKVIRYNAGGRVESWHFKTQTKWNTLYPVWNEA